MRKTKSLFLGGVFFARKLRKAGYVTIIDPFQQRLGDKVGALMVLPAICGEVFWSAAILAALGKLSTPYLSDLLFSETETKTEDW